MSEIESFLAIVQNDQLGPIVVADQTAVEGILSSLIGFVAVNDDRDDSMIVAIQSICESIVTTLASVHSFGASWTVIIKTMAGDSLKSKTLALMLLSSLMNATDDAEEITSKELGQVLIGLLDLMISTGDRVDVGEINSESWIGVTSDSSAFNFVIEECLTIYLSNCTLRKLDKMFRRLVSQFGENAIVAPVVLRAYASIAENGGSAVVLALVAVVRDMILASLKSSSLSSNSSKRKRINTSMLAGLAAITHSCVEELPESFVIEFVDAVSDSVAFVAGNDFHDACVSLANVCDTDGIKRFVKLLMQQTVGTTCDVQESIVGAVGNLWKRVGDAMIPSITEVTIYLNELYNSRDSGVRSAARDLVKEMDRRTGENIGEKLGGGSEDMEDDE